jgi:hypothetical protein
MLRKLLGIDRVGVDQVSRLKIRHQAKLHLSRNFNSELCPDFTKLSVEVKQFDAENRFWEVEIHVRIGKVEDYVGQMKFSKKGLCLEMSHPKGVMRRIEEVRSGIVNKIPTFSKVREALATVR